jgi:dihydropteroate synthase
MGILNTTPDSFSDGGQFDSRATARAHAVRLMQEGADIIDIGGESTRPGADLIAVDEEISRTKPAILDVRQRHRCLCQLTRAKRLWRLRRWMRVLIGSMMYPH